MAGVCGQGERRAVRERGHEHSHGSMEVCRFVSNARFSLIVIDVLSLTSFIQEYWPDPSHPRLDGVVEGAVKLRSVPDRAEE